jgi:hypothetical protein
VVYEIVVACHRLERSFPLAKGIMEIANIVREEIYEALSELSAIDVSGRPAQDCGCGIGAGVASSERRVKAGLFRPYRGSQTGTCGAAATGSTRFTERVVPTSAAGVGRRQSSRKVMINRG